MVQECRDVIATITQQASDIACRTIPQAHPDHLRRRSIKDTQSVKIFLADQNKPVFSHMLPNRKIGRAEQTNVTDMDGARIQVGKRSDKAASQVFVE